MRVIETQKAGVFYGLEDSFDLYRKCVRDLHRCQASTSEQDKVYVLYDLAVGLDHLFGWVRKETKETKAKEECDKRFSFPAPEEVRRKRKLDSSSTVSSLYGSQQALVNQVSRGFKHMLKASSIERKSVEMIFGHGGADSFMGNYYAQFRPNNIATFSMFFVEGENFEPICADLVRHWGQFFQEVLGRERIV